MSLIKDKRAFTLAETAATLAISAFAAAAIVTLVVAVVAEWRSAAAENARAGEIVRVSKIAERWFDDLSYSIPSLSADVGENATDGEKSLFLQSDTDVKLSFSAKEATFSAKFADGSKEDIVLKNIKDVNFSFSDKNAVIVTLVFEAGGEDCFMKLLFTER